MTIRHRCLLVAFALFVCAPAIPYGVKPAQHPNDEKLELYAKHRYRDLIEASNGQLEELFNDFSHLSHAREFMRQEKTEKLYKEFVVRVIEDAINGGVAEAIFQAYILEITPRDILLDAIVPELGPDGKLEGILERESAAVSKRLQRQSAQGYAGEPDFRHYARYLSNHKDVESSRNLIKHMYHTAPGEALHAMIYAENLAVPYPPLRLPNDASFNAEFRPVLYAEHIVSDVIWRYQFRFDVAPAQHDSGKNELNTLSKNKHWWVRLYVAEIVVQHEEFRTTEIIDRLKTDEHELVRQAIERIDAQKNKPEPKPRPVPRDNDTDDTEALNDADPGMPPP